MTHSTPHKFLAAGLALAASVAFVACGPASTGLPPSDVRAGSSREGKGAAASATKSPATPMSSPEEYAERPISAEAGADFFLRLGGGDPYASGMAYPLFLAMMEAFPKELGRDWLEFSDKFGLIPDPAKRGDSHAVPIGLHLTTDPNTNVPWLVANCQFCHADRVRLPSGDVIVAGLGNKSVRPHAYMNALARIGTSPSLSVERMLELAERRAREWNVPWPENMRRPIVEATLAAFTKDSARRADALERLDTALPGRMATIESFALVLSERVNRKVTLAAAIGWSKVPDVRGFPFRETFSVDASGFGSPQALVLDADFLFGARDEWYLTHPHIATSTFLYLKAFSRKLPFPRPIAAALAARGKTLFERRCSECHGYYVDHGGDMRVSYRESVVPTEIVGTDPARADAVTPSFVDAANALALTRGHARVRNTGGYVPPVLIDVWARGLFGHAGQWPSLEVLATPPAERPHAFIVDTRGLYDLDRVGVRYQAVTTVDRSLSPGEYLYRGDAPSYGVEGHPYLSSLPTADRRAVIEYLKTLSTR